MYRDVTSMEASMQSFGRAVVSSRLMKSVVSLVTVVFVRMVVARCL